MAVKEIKLKILDIKTKESIISHILIRNNFNSNLLLTLEKLIPLKVIKAEFT